MHNKKHRKHTSALSRSLSHVFGGSRHNADTHAQAVTPEWQGMPPGTPAAEMWFIRDQRRRLSWSDLPKQRAHSPSLRSTTATCSDSQKRSSTTTFGHSSASAGASSTGESSHYSGYNSSVYASEAYSGEETSSQIIDLLYVPKTSLVWDVRTEPKELRLSQPTSHSAICPNILSFPLTSSASGHIRILSAYFPWSIEIGPKQRAITAGEVLHALYDLLDKDLEDVVWSLADDHRRASIVRAWKARSDCLSSIKRVDFLGSRTGFKGLYRDETLAQKCRRPDMADAPETVLVLLARA